MQSGFGFYELKHISPDIFPTYDFVMTAFGYCPGWAAFNAFNTGLVFIKRTVITKTLIGSFGGFQREICDNRSEAYSYAGRSDKTVR